MVRAGLVVAGLGFGLAGSSGCSLILDFSPGAVPVDAAPDAPYKQDECDYREPNNTPGEAMLFAPTDVGPAAICAGDPEDHDFYRFTVPAMTAKVSVRITFTNRDGDLDLRITNTAGMPLSRSSGVTDGEEVVCPGASPVCPALAAGDYLFEVLPGRPGAANRYDIKLTITPM
ncbi:MAG TPA: PPC domain-containing protein [Kofleriaceae bacterium]|nr:PPC domain-containing protein [Kofleriaceae bacterium]